MNRVSQYFPRATNGILAVLIQNLSASLGVGLKHCFNITEEPSFHLFYSQAKDGHRIRSFFNRELIEFSLKSLNWAIIGIEQDDNRINARDIQIALKMTRQLSKKNSVSRIPCRFEILRNSANSPERMNPKRNI